MPIFEYVCSGCGKDFELLVLKGTPLACPSCSSTAIERQVSAPAIKSESTHGLAMRAAKRRDVKKADENSRAQREYELHHND